MSGGRLLRPRNVAGLLALVVVVAAVVTTAWQNRVRTEVGGVVSVSTFCVGLVGRPGVCFAPSDLPARAHVRYDDCVRVRFRPPPDRADAHLLGVTVLHRAQHRRACPR